MSQAWLNLQLSAIWPTSKPLRQRVLDLGLRPGNYATLRVLISTKGSSRLTRQDLKDQVQHDEFTDAVSNVVTYTQEHRNQVIRWSVIALAILLVAGGIWAFLNYQKTQRQNDLAAAMAVANAQIGPHNEFATTFATEDARNAAAEKALSDVAVKDGNSNEGMIALYYVTSLKAKTNPAGSEADFKRVADSSSNVAPLAKIALAQLYMGDKKTAQAQDLLRSIVNNPTDLVSKAQAQVLLAQTEAPIKPQDSKATLKMISAEDRKRQAVSQAADSVAEQLK